MILRSQNQQFFFKDQRGLPNLIYRTPLKRDPVKVFQLLKALAKAIAKDAKIPTLQACIKSNDHSSISKPTIINYLKLFKLHGIIDELDAWQPHLSTKAIVRKSAIKYFKQT